MTQHFIQIVCPKCHGTEIKKNGKVKEIQRFICLAETCGQNFRLEYKQNARKDGIDKKVEELSINGNGIRGIARILGISQNTVLSILKKKKQSMSTLIS